MLSEPVVVVTFIHFALDVFSWFQCKYFFRYPNFLENKKAEIGFDGLRSAMIIDISW